MSENSRMGQKPKQTNRQINRTVSALIVGLFTALCHINTLSATLQQSFNLHQIPESHHRVHTNVLEAQGFYSNGGSVVD